MARTALLLFGIVALACSRERAPDARVTAPPSAAPSTLAAPPASSPKVSQVAADGCSGREPHDCARTKGCILEQPTYSALECRPAENDCERAVRHADLIGSDADPAVTVAAIHAAEAACRATAGCVVTSGHCSCPCALLGHCDCACGGSYLRRCTTEADKSVFDGRPPSEGRPGPLGALGSALVKVRRARGHFVVDPLPPAQSLVGKRRHEIEGYLGSAHVCRDTTTAPCTAKGQAFYSFYRPPPGARGGGPELLLTYDDKGMCRTAAFVHTR